MMEIWVSIISFNIYFSYKFPSLFRKTVNTKTSIVGVNLVNVG